MLVGIYTRVWFTCKAEALFACREEMLDFMFKCHAVVEKIMECFARGMGLEEDFFKDVSLRRCHMSADGLGHVCHRGWGLG